MMNEQGDHPNQARRAFIAKIAAGSAALGLLPFAANSMAKGNAEEVTAKVRWGMLIDTEKCASDCDACVTACNEEHGLQGHGRPETDAQWIRKVNLRSKLTAKVSSLPMLCQHCENPPCVDVCPTGASFRRADGIVLVDKHTCIGCRYCMMACPYKARSFIHEVIEDQKPDSPRGKGTVESCTFCVSRVDEGKTTACTEACAVEGHKAIVFGDMNDPSSEISIRAKQVPSRQIRAELHLNTGVRYENL